MVYFKNSFYDDVGKMELHLIIVEGKHFSVCSYVSLGYRMVDLD